MHKLLGLILFLYFISGTLLLPQGDFATLPDLPKMYAHCKETEDSDMDVADFIQEHLFMLDEIMGDKPEPDDKPHQPVEFHHIYVSITLTAPHNFKVQQPVMIQSQKAPLIHDDIYLSDFPASVFRPPIA
jgi:hypothetical protein